MAGKWVYLPGDHVESQAMTGVGAPAGKVQPDARSRCRTNRGEMRGDDLRRSSDLSQATGGSTVRGVAFGDRQRVVQGATHERVDERDGISPRQHLDAFHGTGRLAAHHLVQRGQRSRVGKARALAENCHCTCQRHGRRADASETADNAIAERRDRTSRTTGGKPPRRSSAAIVNSSSRR